MNWWRFLFGPREVDELAVKRELRDLDERLKNWKPCKCGNPRCVNATLGFRCRGAT